MGDGRVDRLMGYNISRRGSDLLRPGHSPIGHMGHLESESGPTAVGNGDFVSERPQWVQKRNPRSLFEQLLLKYHREEICIFLNNPSQIIFGQGIWPANGNCNKHQ